ncbi:glutaminase A [Gulosibacter sediminis]|uniref:glutaminase A n=1 Tax=Gulosibacter sediminis TaxID=1729695 RepID=UPI001869610F|nr:glutaminase A [Gulosibacter sediminis]
MKSPLLDYLKEAMLECHDGGEVANYIPELANVDPDQFGVALCTPEGMQYDAGDAAVEFSIQSASKPFAYALALETRGAAGVEEHVNVEPSGDPFYSASVDETTGRPDNPMINIGAITTYALTAPDDWTPAERFEHVRAGLSAFAGRDLEVDGDVYHSEIATAYRNTSLAYLVRSTGHFELESSEVVAGYTRQCAIRVTARDLAVMGMTLGLGGVNPITGHRVVSEGTAQRVLSVMSTCGMYNASGDWMTDVGIPAKSGVGGGIFGVLPGQVAVATFSPRLDTFGNSVRGVALFERLSQEMGMHLMGVPPASDAAVHTFTRDDEGTEPRFLLVLQGPLRFSQSERVLRAFEEIPDGRVPVHLDLARVTSGDRVALRMINEGIRRLSLDGHPVQVDDPKDVLRRA